MPVTPDLLTPTETAIVSGVPIKEVYKVARERLPSGLIVHLHGQMLFKTTAAMCCRIDHDLPKDVPVKVRRIFYAWAMRDPDVKELAHTVGLLRYVVDAESAREAVTSELAAYRKAMAVIAEDSDIQAGAATFKGTRILVHTIADLLKAGASRTELEDDYPHLTAAMLAAAPVYARTHPRRGRPKAPAWRGDDPTATRSYKRTAA
ncbi:MAG TPA: DUF433 domain-containing protein [Caulobacteraceae bacterium]|jgi:uncharacterized protein (DUF433 family)